MSGTTSVPQPTIGPAGIIVPVESAVLAGVQTDMNSAFGGNLNQALSTPQGQIASSVSAIIADKDQQFLYYVSQVDPAFAAGRMQDGIGRIYFITRNPALPTTVQCTIIGLSGTIVPFGSLAQAADGSLYASTQAATIPSSGSISVPFACITTGPIACPAGSLNVIYQTIPGWDTISNPAAGVLGSVVENRSAFETRRSLSVALNAQGSLQAVQGAVLNVANVLDAYVTENNTNAAVTIGSQVIGPNSIYVAVSGGSAAAVAQAIWSKKGPGCNYAGNTSVQVQDTTYSVPYPTYTVTYETPLPLPIFFAVTLAASPTVPSNALSLVQAALMSAFAGGDGGPRARIASRILAARYYGPIAALGSWAQLVSLYIGTSAATQLSVLTGINQTPTISSANITLALV